MFTPEQGGRGVMFKRRCHVFFRDWCRAAVIWRGELSMIIYFDLLACVFGSGNIFAYDEAHKL